MDPIGTHGCFICGASITVIEESDGEWTYACSNCGKEYEVRVKASA